jgi:peptidoglycan/LPS O-acetylase OafA/YrhL
MAVERGAQSPLQSKAATTYIPALDGLRAIAFFCVFLAHTNMTTYGNYVPATFGVTLFFFLSGYLITTLLRGEAQKTGTIKLKDFYIRRALRIFIPMYIAFGVAELLGKMKYHEWHITGLGFLSIVFYFYNYARMFSTSAWLPQGFDVTWSLCVEEHFYLLFPLTYLIILRKRVPRATQVMVLLFLCALGLSWRTYVSYHNFPDKWTYFATDCRFDSILWGSLLALWTNPVLDEKPKMLAKYGGVLATIAFITLVGTMAFGSWHRIDPQARLRYADTLRYSMQGICLYFIFHFAITSIDHWSVRWLENRALRYVGWLSYSLYLIHVSIQGLFDNTSLNVWLLSPVVFVLAFAYACAIRHTVELPLQNLRKRYRHQAPPVSASMPVEGI